MQYTSIYSTVCCKIISLTQVSTIAKLFFGSVCVTQATIHFVKIYLHAFLVISQVKRRVSNPKICLLTCLSRISIKLKQRNSLHLFKQEVNKRQRGHKQKQIACMRSPNLSESSLARPPQNI